jgi:hypothetical protein
MNSDRNFERTALDWLAQGPDRLPDRVLDAVADEIHLTPQRRAARVPWRDPRMNQMTRAVAAIAAVLIALVGGVVLLRPGASPGPGGLAGNSPSPAVSPSSSGSPASSGTSSAASGLPALTTMFTSTVNGYSISYPDGWRVVRATETWPSGSFTSNPDDRSVDSFSGPNLAIYVVSQKLPTSTTPTKWLNEYLGDAALEFSNRPDCATVKTQPIVVDGASGVMNYSCAVVLIDAIVTSGGRAYVFSLQGDSVDKAWMLDLLQTVKLRPESAIDTPPSAAPSASQ